MRVNDSAIRVLMQVKGEKAREIGRVAHVPSSGDLVDIPLFGYDGPLMGYRVVSRRWLIGPDTPERAVLLEVEPYEAVPESLYSTKELRE